MAVNLLRYGTEMQAFTVRLGQESARAAPQYRGLVNTLQDSIDNLLIGPLSNLNFFEQQRLAEQQDRKSTRLNSSHVATSYAVFCLKKKIERFATGITWEMQYTIILQTS